MKPACLLLSFLFSFIAMAQKKTGAATNPSYSDTAHIRLLLDSAKSFRFTDTARHRILTDKALRLAETIGANSLAARTLFEKSSTGPREKAVVFLHQGLVYANAAKDTLWMANINNALGAGYVTLKQEPRALDHFFAALKLLSRTPTSKEFEYAINRIGTLYMTLDNRSSLEYLEKGLALRSESMKQAKQDSSAIAGYLMNLGLAYYKFGDTLRAIEYTERCLSVAEKKKEIENHVFPLLSNLSKFYVEFSDEGLRKAGLTKEDAWKKVKHYCEKIFSLPPHLVSDKFAGAYFTLGIMSLRKKDYTVALAHLLKANQIAKDNNLQSKNGKFYGELSRAYAGSGSYDSAYKYYKAYTAYKESISNTETKKLADRKQAEFDFSKIRDSLQFIQQLTNEKLTKQSLLALQQQQELKLKQALLEVSDQQKILSELAYQKANADVLANQSIIKEKEKQLTISQQEKVLQDKNVALQRQQLFLTEQELSAKKRQQLFILGGAGLLAICTLLIFRNYKNRQKAAAQIAAEKQKAQKAEAVRKMAEFEMHGLRAQLNPHFMFNSLNAIQEQILRQNTENAGAYLTSFARMLRQLLENAEYSFVPLTKELEFLKLYLFMEKLRIPELQFEIGADPAVDTDNTMIPNMILQPYLENAIWHGLSPKPGDKRIEIKIDNAGDSIAVHITDNGVGREKAAELQSRYRKAHKSKGMELLYKRFELIRVEFGSHIKINIEDLTSNNKPAGTRVTLLIPTSLSEPMAMMRETVLHN